jgi:Zn-dependent protease
VVGCTGAEVRSIERMEDHVAAPAPGGTAAGSPPRPTGIPLGRVAGFPLSLTASWVVLAVLITLGWGAVVADRHPLLPQPMAYLTGLGMVAGLLVSVLLHELGHALTARAFGIGVRGITLQMLGGYTELDRDAPSPRVEALVALVGPGVSLLLGLLSLAAAGILPADSVLRELAGWMAFGNLVVAFYNVLPGLPLDGGRALRAGVWAASHDRHLADRVAGWAGRAVAVATVLAGLALYLGPARSWIALVVGVVVAYTLWTGASQAIRVGRLGVRLPMVNAGRLARPLFPVPSGTPLAEAQRQLDTAAAGLPAAPGPVLAVVNSAGQLLGVVNDTALAAVPMERRPWVAVDTVAAGLDPDRILPAQLGGMELIQAVQAHPASEYVVALGEDVVGVLRVADVMRVLQPRGSSSR